MTKPPEFLFTFALAGTFTLYCNGLAESASATSTMQLGHQGRLPFGSPPPAAPVAPKEDAAALKARGSLSHGRQSEINREESGLMNLIHNWENRAVVPASTTV